MVAAAGPGPGRARSDDLDGLRMFKDCKDGESSGGAAEPQGRQQHGSLALPPPGFAVWGTLLNQSVPQFPR